MVAKPRTISLSLYLDDDDYAAFRASPHTKLYDHRRDAGGTVTIWTSKPKQLCVDLERAIDFGATSAFDVLAVSRW